MNQSNYQQGNVMETTQQELREYYEEHLQYELAFQQDSCIFQATLSKDLKFMALQETACNVSLWDLPNKKNMKSYQVQRGSISQMLFSANSKYLIITAFQLRGPYIILIYQVNSDNTQPYEAFYQHIYRIICVAVTSDSKYLLSGGEDKQIKLWDLNDFKSIYSYKLPHEIVHIAISQNQPLFACMCREGVVCLFKSKSKNIRGFDQILKQKINSSSVYYNILLTQDSQKLISYIEKFIQIWGIGTNFRFRLIRKISINLSYPYSDLQILNGRVICSYYKEQFHIWDIETGTYFKIAKSLGFRNFVMTQDANYIVSSRSFSHFQIYKRKNC